MERHSKTEVFNRASECYKLRFESTPSITQEKWVEHCHEVYGDRSEQTYCSYWAKAKDMFDEEWRTRLSNMLGPATDRIRDLLASDNPNDYKEGVRMVYKYTGNEVEKIDSNVKQETTIKVNFGRD